VRTHLLITLSLLEAAFAPGVAQEATPDSVPLPVEALTVTVLRTPIPPALAPYAVAELDATTLRRGKTGAFLKEALSGLPGVQVQNRFNYAAGERLAIRGFGPRAQFGVRGVKVLVDGIPATMPDGQTTLDHVDLASVGHAEVLRGPGSALYGNAAGGVLTLRTALPDAGPVRPQGRIVMGSDGLVHASTGVGGWLGGTALRLSATGLRYDGFRADPEDPSRTYGAADRELLNAQSSTEMGGGTFRLTLNAFALDAENPGSLARASLDDDTRPAWGDNVRQKTRDEIRQVQLGAAWTGDIAGGRGEAAAWALGRSLLGWIPPAVIDLDRRAGGVRLLWGSEDGSGDGAQRSLFWGTGLEIELQRDDRRNFGNDEGVAGPRTLDQLERIVATGVFLRAGAHPARRLRVSGAVRYDRFRFEVEDRFVGGDGGADDSGSRTLDAVSPTLGLVFEAHPSATVWANVATALETPTTTELVNRPDGGGGFNPDLEAQTSRSVEVGARGRLAGRLSWEVVGFHTEVENALVPRVSENGRTFFRNAGASDHDGVEATVDVDLGSGIDLRAAYSRTDARFETYVVRGVEFGGNAVPGLAPNRLQTTLSQGGPAWFWAVEAEWNDEVPVNDANSATSDAYWLVELRAGLVARSLGPLELSPFAGVANLLDERYTAALTVNAFGGRFYEPGPGRTAYVGLSARPSRR
jgi:iron complex outermembrane receptor protein